MSFVQIWLYISLNMLESSEINGYKALELMSELSNQSKPFAMMHIKADGSLRKVDRCYKRKALPDDIFNYNSEIYFPYYDATIQENRMAFKKLIRYIAINDGEWIKINWYE